MLTFEGTRTDLSGFVLGDLVLCVLLAGLALAVGLTGLGDVDLEEPELLASALSHDSHFHFTYPVVANAGLLCPELRSQLILCPEFPNCFEVNGGSWHDLSVRLDEFVDRCPVDATGQTECESIPHIHPFPTSENPGKPPNLETISRSATSHLCSRKMSSISASVSRKITPVRHHQKNGRIKKKKKTKIGHGESLPF